MKPGETTVLYWETYKESIIKAVADVYPLFYSFTGFCWKKPEVEICVCVHKYSHTHVSHIHTGRARRLIEFESHKAFLKVGLSDLHLILPYYMFHRAPCFHLPFHHMIKEEAIPRQESRYHIYVLRRRPSCDSEEPEMQLDDSFTSTIPKPINASHERKAAGHISPMLWIYQRIS